MQLSIAFVSLALALLIVKIVSSGRRASNLPPGPPTIPILGNLHQLPTEFLFLKFAEWAKVYGDVYTIKFAHKNVVILNTPEAVRNILEKHAGPTRDRPMAHVGGSASEGLNIAFMSSEDPLWKKQRKIIKATLTHGAIDKFYPTQKVEMAKLLFDIMEEPQKTYQHIARSTVSGYLTMFYGVRAKQFEGSEVEDFFDVVERFNAAADPTAAPPVDIFPVLKYIPEWAGAQWKKLCRDSVFVRNRYFFDRLLDPLDNRMKKGEMVGAYLEDLLSDLPKLGLTRKEFGHMGGALMEGSSESTTTVLKNFVAAMISFPEHQKRAHEEMDAVVGSDRMPTIDDLPNLKYTTAIINELLRMRPVFPNGVPHQTLDEDVVYKDYVIPKGSIIYMNIWEIGRNEEAYDKPEEFNPARWLKTETGVKPGMESYYHRANVMFGAGRRMCPGEPLARRTIALYMSHLIWAFNFSKNAGSAKPGTIPFDMANYARPGIIVFPSPFSCDVQVRSEERANVIKEEYAKHWEEYLSQ